jgi:hypothetical protein
MPDSAPQEETESMAAASDTQTAIDILKADNERLNSVVTTLTGERDKYKGDHTAAAKELEQLRSQVGNPDEHRKRADELQQKLRVVTHKAEFSKIAEAAGVHRDVIDDLFQLSGYQPAADDVDPKTLNDLVGELKKAKPRYFADPAQQGTAATQAAAQQTQRPIPGAGRGASHDPTRTGSQITRAQLADPSFMLNKKNKDVIKDAIKNGRVID